MQEASLTSDLVSLETGFEEMSAHLLDDSEQNYQIPSMCLAHAKGLTHISLSNSQNISK